MQGRKMQDHFTIAENVIAVVMEHQRYTKSKKAFIV